MGNAQNDKEGIDKIVQSAKNILDPDGLDGYVEKLCLQEIKQAKKELEKYGIPIYEYCSERSRKNNFDSIVEEVCARYNIIAKPKYCFSMCGSDMGEPDGYCYSSFLKEHLVTHKKIGIIDSIIKYSILERLKAEPDFIVGNASFFSNQVYYTKKAGYVEPKMFAINEWNTQYYHMSDTLWLNKEKYEIKKFFTKPEHSSTGAIREYPMNIIIQLTISRKGEMTLWLNDKSTKEMLDHHGFEKVSTELIARARNFVTQKYKKWKPATFYGREIASLVSLSVVLRN